MKAVILCGGLGTRMREETEYKPKPMVEIGGRPMLWHIMKLYSHYGIRDFVICLGYKGWTIKEYFLNYEAISHDFTLKLGHPPEIRYHQPHDEQSWSISFVDTGVDAMTAARIRKIRPMIGDEPFLLTYGDGLACVNIGELMQFHQKHGKIATVTAVRPPGRFGEMLIRNGMVHEFNEKPQVTEGYINGGFFVLSPGVFDYIDSTDETQMFEKIPLQHLARDKELVPYCYDGYWQAMDTFREYQMLNQAWNEGNAPWKVWS